MKITSLFIVLLIALKTFGQSDSIERAILFNKLQSKKISATAVASLIEKWEERIKKEKYPDVPINNKGKIQYSFILEFPDIMKEQLCSRILEWLAINYRIIPANLYLNIDDGKIICSNSININDDASAYYTFVISVKNEKILMEFINIVYQISKQSYGNENSNLSEYKIDQVFPIILKDSYDWKFYFKLLKTIDNHIKNDVKDIIDYIINYEELYRF